MPVSRGRRSQTPPSRVGHRALRLIGLLPGLWLAGCATTLPDPPHDPIDRLPFTRVVPLIGEQAPETEGGRVYAVRWTVRACPVNGAVSRHVVIGTRGSTSQSVLPPGALAALVVCDAHDGTSIVRKTQVHHGDDVPANHYTPVDVPFVELQDNTLEILAFEPGPLVLEAQPVDANNAPVGAPHRFDELIVSGKAWRQDVSDSLAKMREEHAESLTSSTTTSSSFFPSVTHVQY